ncbi:hypothetical protein BKA80DRAFT_2817 [Phyllosticta citrichinensis]
MLYPVSGNPTVQFVHRFIHRGVSPMLLRSTALVHYRSYMYTPTAFSLDQPHHNKNDSTTAVPDPHVRLTYIPPDTPLRSARSASHHRALVCLVTSFPNVFKPLICLAPRLPLSPGRRSPPTAAAVLPDHVLSLLTADARLCPLRLVLSAAVRGQRMSCLTADRVYVCKNPASA